jgi:hypothetical protein
MINRKKMFWTAFGIVYLPAILYGVSHERPDAFPNFGWVLAYLALIAVWAALASLVVLGLVTIFQHSSEIASRATDGIRAMGRWFTN